MDFDEYEDDSPETVPQDEWPINVTVTPGPEWIEEEES